MTQVRKKRILVYEIRITLWTDFLQEMAEKTMDAVLIAMIEFDRRRGRVTEWEVVKRVLDGKTYAEITKEEKTEAH